MTPLETVLSRLADEPEFADRLRSDPATALAGMDLSDGDLRRIDRLLRDPPDLRTLLGSDDL